MNDLAKRIKESSKIVELVKTVPTDIYDDLTKEEINEHFSKDPYEKPELELQGYSLNYFACRDYINKKYDIDIDDYANKYRNSDDSAPYLNFWHKLIEHFEIKNESYFLLYEELIEYYNENKYDEEWFSEIIKLFFNEFGEYKNKEGFLRFWVEW